MFKSHRFRLPAIVVGAAALAAGCAEKKAAEPSPVPAQPLTAPATAPVLAEAQPSAPAAPAPAPRTGRRVQFGIMPGNYEEENNGVLVGEVIPGTAAEDAGIRVDDRLVSWNGKTIKDVENWMEYLGAAKPGDVVEVGVLRAGKTIPIKVTLKARRD
jgi:S1-C subfamily serine protease